MADLERSTESDSLYQLQQSPAAPSGRKSVVRAGVLLVGLAVAGAAIVAVVSSTGGGGGPSWRMGGQSDAKLVQTCNTSAAQCQELSAKFHLSGRVHHEPGCVNGLSLGCNAMGGDCCQFCGFGDYSGNDCQFGSTTAPADVPVTAAATTAAAPPSFAEVGTGYCRESSCGSCGMSFSNSEALCVDAQSQCQELCAETSDCVGFAFASNHDLDYWPDHDMCKQMIKSRCVLYQDSHKQVGGTQSGSMRGYHCFKASGVVGPPKVAPNASKFFMLGAGYCRANDCDMCTKEPLQSATYCVSSMGDCQSKCDTKCQGIAYAANLHLPYCTSWQMRMGLCDYCKEQGLDRCVVYSGDTPVKGRQTGIQSPYACYNYAQ